MVLFFIWKNEWFLNVKYVVILNLVVCFFVVFMFFGWLMVICYVGGWDWVYWGGGGVYRNLI